MALTAEQKAKQKREKEREITQWYQSMYKSSGYTGKVPDAIIDKAYNQKMSRDQFENYVRLNDKRYTSSDAYITRRADFLNMLKSAFPDTNLAKLKNVSKIMKAYAGATGSNTEQLGNLFKNWAMKQPEFAAANPGFSAWYEREGRGYDVAGPAAMMRAFGTETGTVQKNTGNWWRALGLAGEPPDTLMTAALEGGWDEDTFGAAVRSGADWSTTDPAAKRGLMFDTEWNMLYGAGTPVNAALREKYIRAPDAVGFGDFFYTDIRDSAEFVAKFPNYRKWEASQAEEGGDVGYTYYMRERKDLIDAYREDLGPDAVVPPDLLDRAMTEQWSTAVFTKWVRKNDPDYKNSPAYLNKAKEWDDYWTGLFGSNAQPDTALREEYLSSDYTEPKNMWDKVRKSNIFQEQYAYFDPFEKAQAARGNQESVLNDPTLYKEYQQAYKDAFSQLGMNVPTDMEKQFFVSGIGQEQFKRNISDYADTNQSYSWASGQQADLATAGGIADETAGGDLKKRMKAALDTHIAYNRSSFNQYETDKADSTEMLTQNI